MINSLNLLEHFYHGNLSEEDRLEIERQLLIDPEFLLDYLDLKRQHEAALKMPQKAPHQVWVYLSQRWAPPKKLWLPLGLASLASSLFVFFIFFKDDFPVVTPAKLHSDRQTEMKSPILIDSSSQVPMSSGVL